MADLLAAKPELVQLGTHHAEYYFKEGAKEFYLNALTDEQKRNFERNTGHRLRGRWKSRSKGRPAKQETLRLAENGLAEIAA